MISHLNYDAISHSIFFDITFNHFRDIYNYNISDGIVATEKNDIRFDERNMVSSSLGIKIYSMDKSGIFNLYMIDDNNYREGYISNVTGGAFMPDISEDGKIIFSLYQDGGYKISVLEQAIYINDDFVGYDKNYFLNNEGMTPPINNLNLTKSKNMKISFLICSLCRSLCWIMVLLNQDFIFNLVK